MVPVNWITLIIPEQISYSEIVDVFSQISHEIHGVLIHSTDDELIRESEF